LLVHFDFFEEAFFMNTFIITNGEGIPIFSRRDKLTTFDSHAKLCRYLILNKGLWIGLSVSEVFFCSQIFGESLVIIHSQQQSDHTLYIIASSLEGVSLEATILVRLFHIEYFIVLTSLCLLVELAVHTKPTEEVRF
jgi:hypothetical protein